MTWHSPGLPTSPPNRATLPSPLFTDPITTLGCAPQVEKELSEICASILQLLDEHLIPTASSGESKVFYLKMKVSVPQWCHCSVSERASSVEALCAAATNGLHRTSSSEHWTSTSSETALHARL